MSTDPTPNGGNGGRRPRDALGRFVRGDPGGPGNPHSRAVGQLRTALLESVTPAALRRTVTKLVKRAESGDILAAKLVLSYVLGPPLQAGLLERIEAVESEVGNEPTWRG